VTQPTSTNDPPQGDGHTLRERARRRVAAGRRRYAGSWLEDFVARLGAVEFGNSIILFGAALLLSVLPLFILLSSAADERIDDDLSRHIGLDSRGAHIIEHLFRHSPSHEASAIILGVIVGFAGTVTVASSLALIYERAFGQPHRGWRDLWRFIVWVLVLGGVLIAEGSYDEPIRSAVGAIPRDLVSLAVITVFLWWSMHFLLAGRVGWRELVRPAIVSGVLWVVFALVSSIYFSSALIAENKLYGTLGVVFILATWFIAIGAVMVLSAVIGAVWQDRTGPMPLRSRIG
jgi:membrane protein